MHARRENEGRARTDMYAVVRETCMSIVPTYRAHCPFIAKPSAERVYIFSAEVVYMSTFTIYGLVHCFPDAYARRCPLPLSPSPHLLSARFTRSFFIFIGLFNS